MIKAILLLLVVWLLRSLSTRSISSVTVDLLPLHLLNRRRSTRAYLMILGLPNGKYLGGKSDYSVAI